jgi:hypothetical protein
MACIGIIFMLLHENLSVGSKVSEVDIHTEIMLCGVSLSVHQYLAEEVPSVDRNCN